MIHEWGVLEGRKRAGETISTSGRLDRKRLMMAQGLRYALSLTALWERMIEWLVLLFGSPL